MDSHALESGSMAQSCFTWKMQQEGCGVSNCCLFDTLTDYKPSVLSILTVFDQAAARGVHSQEGP